jgi:glycosyltransferase involved in cell wall biosynthesis
VRNVLIISFLFNQTELIGTVRMRGLAKYLPEFGWNPVVLTVETSAETKNKIAVFKTPYENTITLWKKRIGIPPDKSLKESYHLAPTGKEKKTITDTIIYIWEEIFAYPDPTINWSVSALEKGKELVDEYKFDAILSSIRPCTSHIIAGELVKRKKIPWVADFRDLWTQNHYFKHSAIREFFEKRLELDTLSSADALVTISDPFSEKLRNLHKNKTVCTITNGFDPEQLNPGVPLTEKFSITYTGKIYRGRQDPEPLFRVLRGLIDEKKIDPALIEVRFFGDREEWLINDCKKYHLEDVVRIHGHISREESVRKQRESQVLLLLAWNDREEKGIYTGKIFDYLAARRPVLAVGLPGSVVSDVLSQTGAGITVTSDQEIKDQVMTFYREYSERGFVSYAGIPAETEKYSHREMARKFAKVLEDVSKPEGMPGL